MNSTQMASELILVAKDVLGALLEDYGISDALSEKIWNELGLKKLSDCFSNADWYKADEIGEKNPKIAGLLVDLAKDIPDDKRKVYGELRYEVEIVSVNEARYANNFYEPAKKRILISYNAGLPMVLKDNGGISAKLHSQLKRDIARFDVSVRHEVTHALRDAETGHISKFTQKMSGNPQLNEFYNREHDNIEFERDAIVNGLSKLKRRMNDKWDELTLADLRQLLPGLKLFPAMPMEYRKKWIDRLIREGLMGKKMLKEFRSGYEFSTPNSI